MAFRPSVISDESHKGRCTSTDAVASHICYAVLPITLNRYQYQVCCHLTVARRFLSLSDERPYVSSALQEIFINHYHAQYIESPTLSFLKFRSLFLQRLDIK